MARRRSRIKQEINRILYSGDPSRYTIYYLDRPPGTGTSRLAALNASRIRSVNEWAMLLDDGDTVIPLHRVVEIRDSEGRILWSRRPSERGDS